MSLRNLLPSKPVRAAGPVAFALALVLAVAVAQEAHAGAVVWSPPETLASSDLDYAFSSPRVAVDKRGAAVAAWTDQGVPVASFRGSGSGATWSAASAIVPSGDPLHVKMTTHGGAVALVAPADPAAPALEAVFAVSGAWAAPAGLSTAGADVRASDLAVDEHGMANAVWIETATVPAGCAIRVATGDSVGGWSAPQTIGEGCFGSVSIATGKGGHAIVVWGSASPLAPSSIVASVRGSDGLWGPPATINPATYRQGPPSAGISDRGIAVVVWSNVEGVMWSRSAPDGTWSTPAPAGDLAPPQSPVVVTVSGRGRAVAVFGDVNLYSPLSAIELGTDSSQWTAPVPITPEGSTPDRFVVEGSAKGGVVVGWTDSATLTTGVSVRSARAPVWTPATLDSDYDSVSVAAAGRRAVALWDLAFWPTVAVRASTTRF